MSRYPNINTKCIRVPENQVEGYATAVTSASTIVLTSGANTIHVTDIFISVDADMTVDLRSATTAFATVYVAARGGLVWPMQTPYILNSNQSLTFQQNTSGNCAVTAIGYRLV